MLRGLSDREKELFRRLVGASAPFLPILEAQMETCLVEDSPDGSLKLKPMSEEKINTNRKVLGSGSLYDTDNIPITFDLLQDEGFISKLLIQKADSSRIKHELDFGKVKSLGFGQGLTLER